MTDTETVSEQKAAQRGQVYASLWLAGTLAMTVHMYLAGGWGNWLSLPRISQAVSAGLLFGHALGFVGLAAFVPGRRWLALLLSVIVGVGAWWVHMALTLYHTSPEWGVLLAGGIGLSIAALLIRWVRQRTLIQQALAFVLAWGSVYAPIYIAYQRYLAAYQTASPPMALLYFAPDNALFVWVIGVPFALVIVVGMWTAVQVQ